MCIYRGCTCPKCTNKARMHQHSAHAAWIEAAHAAVERSGSHLCKCTHNKRITAIISFYCLSFRENQLNLLMSNPMPDYMLA